MIPAGPKMMIPPGPKMMIPQGPKIIIPPCPKMMISPRPKLVTHFQKMSKRAIWKQTETNKKKKTKHSAAKSAGVEIATTPRGTMFCLLGFLRGQTSKQKH